MLLRRSNNQTTEETVLIKDRRGTRESVISGRGVATVRTRDTKNVLTVSMLLFTHDCKPPWVTNVRLIAKHIFLRLCCYLPPGVPVKEKERPSTYCGIDEQAFGVTEAYPTAKRTSIIAATAFMTSLTLNFWIPSKARTNNSQKFTYRPLNVFCANFGDATATSYGVTSSDHWGSQTTWCHDYITTLLLRFAVSITLRVLRNAPNVRINHAGTPAKETAYIHFRIQLSITWHRSLDNESHTTRHRTIQLGKSTRNSS